MMDDDDDKKNGTATTVKPLTALWRSRFPHILLRGLHRFTSRYFKLEANIFTPNPRRRLRCRHHRLNTKLHTRARFVSVCFLSSFVCLFTRLYILSLLLLTAFPVFALFSRGGGSGGSHKCFHLTPPALPYTSPLCRNSTFQHQRPPEVDDAYTGARVFKKTIAPPFAEELKQEFPHRLSNSLN